MDEQRNFDAVMSSVLTLDQRLREIEEYQRAAPYSEATLRELRAELDSLKKRVGVPTGLPKMVPDVLTGSNTPPEGPVEPQDEGFASEGSYTGDLPDDGYGAPVFEPGRVLRTARPNKFSEKNLGKYLLSILAAVLIFLAVGVLITAIWPVIPGLIKFIWLFGVGAGLESLGVQFAAKSENKKNGFWLAITGLGAGIGLLSIAGGCLSWGLYPMAVAGLLAAGWFAGNLIIASKLDSPVFYVISYIGGAMAVLLSIELSKQIGPRDGYFALVHQMPIAFMPGLILFIGGFAAVKHPRKCLKALNYLAALFFLYILGAFAESLAFHVNASAGGYRFFDSFAAEWGATPGFLLAIIIIAIAVYLMYLSTDYMVKDAFSDIQRTVAVLIAAADVCFAVYGGVDSVMAYYGHVEIVTAGIVCAVFAWAMYMRFEHIEYILLGITVPVLALFSLASDIEFNLGCAMPVGFCVFLYVMDRILNKYRTKLALAISIAASGFMVISQQIYTAKLDPHLADDIILAGDWVSRPSGDITLTNIWYLLAICCAYITITSLTYIKSLKSVDESNFDVLASLGYACMIALAGSKFVTVLMEQVAPDANPVVFVGFIGVAVLLLHRWYVQQSTWPMSGAESTARWLWCVAAGMVVIYLHGVVSVEQGMTRGVGIMLLLAMVASSVAWSAMTGYFHDVFRAVFFANEVMVYSSVVVGFYDLGLSVIGLLLCAGFIWLGFLQDILSMRRMGLAGMIIYVLKIVFIDISVTGGVVSTAFSLLLAGVICFAVSFVYNRLDKKYNNSEAEASVAASNPDSSTEE